MDGVTTVTDRGVPPAEAGQTVHRAWRDGMLAQGRHVATERMSWDTLSDEDKALDAAIEAAARASQPLTLDVERVRKAARHMYGVLNQMTIADQRDQIGTFISAISQALDEYERVVSE